MATKRFRGIIPALYTCYEDNGAVNLAETVRLAEWLIEKGAGGFYLCGTTGNGLLLTMDERKSIVEAVAGSVGGHVPLMVHVGTMATAEAIELARHAATCRGVCAISSLPPQYYPMPLAHEIAHLSKIAGATDLPFYPYVFGETVDKCGVQQLIDAFMEIQRIGGIKAFVKDLSVHQTLIHKGPADWELLHGFDQCLFHALAVPGVDGAIGSTYNVVPELVTAIFRKVQAKDYQEAIDLQRHYVGFWSSIQGHPFLPFVRYFLTKRGFKMGLPRLPLQPPSDEVIEKVEGAMSRANFDISTGGLG